MKKEYIKPAMRVAELRHKHHILVGSDEHSEGKINPFQDDTFHMFDGEDDTIGDGDEDDII